MAKSKYTLGIHVGHDSSVALAKNGKLVAASTEERFTRLKHYSSLPIRALEFCLKHENIGIDEISEIIIPTIGAQENVEVLLGRLKQGTVKKEVTGGSKNLLDYFRYFMVGIFRLLNVWTPLVPPSYIQTYKYPKNKPLLYIEHHLAHAAAAYYTSGFNEKTLIVCADGSGDGLSTTIWLGENGRLTPVLKVGREGSFGAFYGLITEALGWWVGDGEQKTMALASTGNMKKTKGILDEFAPTYENGNLKRGYNWGFPGIWEDKGGSHFHFSDNPKIIKLIKKYGREDIAAEAQRILEEQLVGLVKYWIKKTDVKYLAVTGGVFLNVKANKKLWELGLLKNFHVFPDVGESGVAAGAALYGYFKSSEEIVPALENIYLGPSYKNSEIEEILSLRKINYRFLQDQDLLKVTAKLLSENKIVGWFQGRAEIGPRALG
ncbi:MAG: carbamoyltransferase N-terminal domain-containing protein, partial [Candidatus Gracilibacteria bacterium]